MENSVDLARYGFKSEGRTSHNSRTMMLKELSLLLNIVSLPNPTKEEYLKAIIEDNCLGKKSGITRELSASHLENLYTLNPETLVFKALRFFWRRDITGHPLLAFTCVYARDYIINRISPFILEKPEGEAIPKETVMEVLDNQHHSMFSKATLESTARNVMSTFAQSGHLKGKLNKIRSYVKPTAGSVAYALLLSYICGHRGESLFFNEFIKILDCSREKAVELTETASRSGWLSFKHIDNIYDVSFPNNELGAIV
jgi:hypothetical protein